jgi:GntR family transcriptional regulator
MGSPFTLAHPGIARYVQLAMLFRRRIELGQWRVGERIPTLEALVDELGVARATVRHALGELEADGLLARYRAKGTFVTRPPTPPQVIELATDWSSLSRAHESDAIEVLAAGKIDRPPCTLPEGVRFAPGYQHLRRLHRRNGVPYLLGEVYLDTRVYRRLPRRQVETTPMLKVLKETPGVHIAKAQQTLTVNAADLEAAQRLDVSVNSPVAIVRRCAYDRAGTLFYYSHGTYRGDQVRLEISLK